MFRVVLGVASWCLVVGTLARTVHSEGLRGFPDRDRNPREAKLADSVRTGGIERVKAASEGMNLRLYADLDAFLLSECRDVAVIRYLSQAAGLSITELQTAAAAGDLATARSLLKNRAQSPFSSIDTTGYSSPLRLAIRRRDEPMVRLLLDEGLPAADPLAQITGARDPVTPLAEAIEQGQPRIVALLCKAGAPLEESQTTLVPKNPAQRSNAAMGWTSLSNEARRRRIRELVASGEWIEEPNPAANQYCPLGKAIWAGRESVVKVLLDAGADPNVLMGNEQRPLHAAVKSGHPGIVKALISKGADIDSLDSLGRSPLMLALLGHGDIADQLRSAGAKLPSVD
jgi:ankyrin repeat protein